MALLEGGAIGASGTRLMGTNSGPGVELVSPADAVISHVVALKAEEEPAAAAGTEGAPAATSEPEVIKKGKKEEEAEADTKAKKK